MDSIKCVNSSFVVSHAESRKHKEKNWEENDFYDSDEDNFLDRTGSGQYNLLLINIRVEQNINC